MLPFITRLSEDAGQQMPSSVRRKHRWELVVETRTLHLLCDSGLHVQITSRNCSKYGCEIRLDEILIFDSKKDYNLTKHDAGKH
ncbi:hypothetical protein E2C01_040290 [Portunus trituberculatus]|uniref:Uncharacterized protein n=1 Tax=Portunus trituberculatus TaxID=210409 RepID=A0A5B7FMY4_PORTR|nr:hypothetical protein [Portunus trituberculatus]